MREVPSSNPGSGLFFVIFCSCGNELVYVEVFVNNLFICGGGKKKGPLLPSESLSYLYVRTQEAIYACRAHGYQSSMDGWATYIQDLEDRLNTNPRISLESPKTTVQ